LLKLNSNCRYK